VRVTLTGENEGYYRDFTGGAEEIAATLRTGWLFQGQPSPRTGRPRGTSVGDLPPAAFVHCIQNHDQIGNRALGERLNHDVPLAAYRAASALLLLSPYMPLLFMGQEWAASSPFLFFTDHDPELGKLVTEGRREEFKHFTAFSGERVPDPQALETFECSKLRWDERAVEPHAGILRLCRDLLQLRRSLAAPDDQRRSFQVHPAGEAAVVLRRIAADGRPLLVVANLRGPLELDLAEEMAEAGPWTLLLDSEDPRYSGRENDLRQSRPEQAIAGKRVTMDGPQAIILQLR
jgi:maltooligosyltrehalose trehalohydrolase